MVNPNAPNRRARFAAAACHGVGLVGYVHLLPWILPWAPPVGLLQWGFAVVGFLVWPLLLIVILWRSLRHLHAIVDESGRSALNFWLTLTLFEIIAAAVLSFLTMAICGNTGMYDANIFQAYWGLGIFFGVPVLAGVVALIQVLTTVLATIEALLHGKVSRYQPWSRQFFRGGSSGEP